MPAMVWLLLGGVNSAWAVPVQFSHSGRLLDSFGTPLSSSVSLKIEIFDAPTGGPFVHSETFGVTPQDGYYGVVLGTALDLDHTELGVGSLYVEVSVDGALLGARELLSESPRAAVSAVSASVDTGPAGTSITAGGQLNLGAVSAEPCGPDGALAWDSTNNALSVCLGAAWRRVSPLIVTEVGGVREWSDGTYATSCLEYLEPSDTDYLYAGDTGDGVYRIDPDGSGATFAPVDLYCDQTTDDGGWTLIHKTDQSSSADRTSSGANLPGLTTTAVDGVAILPTAAHQAMGSTYRILTTTGKRFFFRGAAPYHTHDVGTATYPGTDSKLAWTSAWIVGVDAQTSANHGTCISTQNPFGGEHVCIQRFCCNNTTEDGTGIWVNGGGWSGAEEAGTGWVR